MLLTDLKAINELSERRDALLENLKLIRNPSMSVSFGEPERHVRVEVGRSGPRGEVEITESHYHKCIEDQLVFALLDQLAEVEVKFKDLGVDIGVQSY